MIIVLIVTLVAIVLFVTELLPVDVTAMLVTVVLMLTNVLEPSEGLAGFSNVGTISVFALLLLSIGLESTGVVNYMVMKIEDYATDSEVKSIFGISVIVGGCSAFLNNTAIVAIMLPVVARLASKSGISVSKLLMPLSFAAMAGGCITIIGTSTNVLVSGIYSDYTKNVLGKPDSFGIFEFSIIGIILFGIFLIYMLTIGRLLLPSRSKQGALTSEYELDNYLMQVVVGKNSPLIGQKIRNDFHAKFGIRILEIIRGDSNVEIPQNIEEEIRHNDVLSIKSAILDFMEIRKKYDLRIKRNVELDDKDLTSEHAVLFEAVIGNNSYLLGKQIKDINFRQLFNAVPLAIRRSGASLPTKVSEIELQFGDTILMEARRRNLNKFYNSRDFIVLEKVKKPNFRTRHMLLSTFIVLAVILTVSLGFLALEVAALTGCVLMYITGCVSPRYVYRKMEWRIIFLLAGMIPLGIAVEKTGLSRVVAMEFLNIFGSFSPSFIVSGLFAITVILTSFMSNNATAILLAPIAINLATELNMDPKAFLVTVMFAASTSFLTPIGYQTNTLVYGPGKYRFSDYLKVGGLLTFLFWIAATILIPYFYF